MWRTGGVILPWSETRGLQGHSGYRRDGAGASFVGQVLVESAQAPAAWLLPLLSVTALLGASQLMEIIALACKGRVWITSDARHGRLTVDLITC